MGKKRRDRRAVMNLNEERVFRIFHYYINELDGKVKALEPIASSDKELHIFKRGMKGGIYSSLDTLRNLLSLEKGRRFKDAVAELNRVLEDEPG